MRRRVVAGVASFLLIATSRAQPPEPSQLLTLIVPTAPGVAGDQLAWIVAEALSRIFENRVRVENVAGDSGVAGTNAIAAAAHDGTVLGLGISSAMIGGRLLSRSAKFNPTEDFQWFTILGRYPAAMVVPANAAQSDVAAWVASARETPTPLTYASVGTGSAGHLAGGFLRMAQGARLTHRAVEAPDERYALLADGKIAACSTTCPTRGPLLRDPETGSSPSPRRPAHPCSPTRLLSESCGTNRSTLGGSRRAERARRRGVSPARFRCGGAAGTPSSSTACAPAGVTFMGLSRAAARCPFSTPEILRNASR